MKIWKVEIGLNKISKFHKKCADFAAMHPQLTSNSESTRNNTQVHNFIFWRYDDVINYFSLQFYI